MRGKPGNRKGVLLLIVFLSIYGLLVGCGADEKGGEQASYAKTVTVPSTEGKSLEEARALLEEEGLVLGNLVEEFSETVPAGCVIRTDPPIGEKVEEGSAVNLVLSKGPYPVTLPDLSGKMEKEAHALLQSLGWQANVRHVYNDIVSQGRVISMEPAPGTTLNKGQQVILVVSLGPAYITCSRCGGKGTVTLSEVCPECGGTGTCFT